MSTLEYYFENGSHVIFEKYTIDTNGIIRNKKTGKIVCTRKSGVYNSCNVRDNDGKIYGVRVCRALASTFYGKPPTLTHTADHVDRNPENDTLDNTRWNCKKGQCDNRTMPETFKSAFIIIKDDMEKTTKEWVVFLRTDTNHLKREYTESMIKSYAQKKQHGFSFKKYPDLPGEVWKMIQGSKNWKGYWEISDMNRVKYVTKYAEKVLSGERLGLKNGYPIIAPGKCHILSFKTFYPKEYGTKKPDEVVLHTGDDKLDFRPHMLRLGTTSDNMYDAHDNGCHDGTKTARTRCVSYINGVFEAEHDSQTEAAKYLKLIGFEKGNISAIGKVINEKRFSAYGRTWKKI